MIFRDVRAHPLLNKRIPFFPTEGCSESFPSCTGPIYSAASSFEMSSEGSITFLSSSGERETIRHDEKERIGSSFESTEQAAIAGIKRRIANNAKNAS